MPHARTPLSLLPCRTPRQKSARSHAAKHFSSPSSPQGAGLPSTAAASAACRPPLHPPMARPLFPTVVLVVSPVQHSSALLPARDGTGRAGMGRDGAGEAAAPDLKATGRRRPDPRALIRRPAALRPPGPSVPVVASSPSSPRLSPASPQHRRGGPGDAVSSLKSPLQQREGGSPCPPPARARVVRQCPFLGSPPPLPKVKPVRTAASPPVFLPGV